MKKKILHVAIVSTLIVGTSTISLLPDDADARGFSRSFSFSRSSFRSSSFSSKKSGSFWKSSSNKGPKSKANKKITGGTKQTTSLKNLGKPKAAAKSSSALMSLRKKFKKPSVTPITGKKTKLALHDTYQAKYKNNPVYASARTVDRSTYYQRRASYYHDYTPPMYVYNSAPSYGLWDTIFLYYMLNNMTNASQFAYNHQNDEDYQQWRRDAEKQAETNAELKAKLAKLDAEVKKLQGQPIDPSYLPDGTDPDIALSLEALYSQKPVLSVCTGDKSGWYYKVVNNVYGTYQSDVIVKPVVTNGSQQSIDNVVNGKCDAAIVQRDAFWNYVEDHQQSHLPFTKIATPIKSEVVHLICNRKVNEYELEDLPKDVHMYLTSGSGSLETWKNITREKPQYQKIPSGLTNDKYLTSSYQQAIVATSNDPKGCTVYVAAVNSEFLLNVDKGIGKRLQLIEIDIDDFDGLADPSGDEIYDKYVLGGLFSDAKYDNLLSEYWIAPDTISVPGDLILSDAWKSKHQQLASTVTIKFATLQDKVDQLLRGGK